MGQWEHGSVQHSHTVAYTVTMYTVLTTDVSTLITTILEANTMSHCPRDEMRMVVFERIPSL